MKISFNKEVSFEILYLAKNHADDSHSRLNGWNFGAAIPTHGRLSDSRILALDLLHVCVPVPDFSDKPYQHARAGIICLHVLALEYYFQEIFYVEHAA